MRFFLLLIVIAFSINGFAQNIADTIAYEKLNSKYIAHYQGYRADIYDLELIVEQNKPALKEITKARRLKGVSAFVAGVGGFCVGFPIGNAAAGGTNPPWFLVAIGGGFFLVTIPISSKANEHLLNGIKIYNRSILNPPSSTPESE